MKMNRQNSKEEALGQISRVVNGFKPDFLGDDTRTWQNKKSGMTRQALLEATIECLAERGYSQTSTQLVANTAQVSRGAMLHHYATKIALIDGVIDYINYLRVRNYIPELTKLSDKERIKEGKGIEILWRTMQTPAYAAYLELHFAAEKDEELASIFDPKAKKYDDSMIKLLPSLFPEWQNNSPEEFRLAYDVAFIALNGLTLSGRLMGSKKRRVAIRKFLFNAINAKS